MQEAKPYTSLEEATEALDNGGRFFHFFSKAGDDVITPAELRKVAGAFGNDRTAAMFFQLATWNLSEADHRKLQALLDPETRLLIDEHRARVLGPEAFETDAEVGHPVIVEGAIRLLDDETKTGMILVPVIINNVTTIQMIPTSTTYTVYEVGGEDGCAVLTPKRSTPLKGTIRFAGLAKETPAPEKGQPSPGPRLEALFYSQV